MTMRIGLDLDNTILDYSESIRAATTEVFGVELPNVPKNELKRILSEEYGEDAWTVLQGYVYGEYSTLSSLFPAFGEFLDHAHSRGYEIEILSHKTIFPIAGPTANLREYALLNLHRLGVLEKLKKGPTGSEVVSFFETKDEKIKAANSLVFDFFVDDLFDVTQRIKSRLARFHMFCNDLHATKETVLCVENWGVALRILRNIENSV